MKRLVVQIGMVPSEKAVSPGVSVSPGDRISLVFYVVYTLWYGFAIMYMFEGWGHAVGTLVHISYIVPFF
jgi:hypothetical protein